MRLFLKHLTRSVRRRPLQPFMLIVTLTLAIASSIFFFSVGRALDDEANVMQAEKYGSADIAVTLTGDCASRFMFTADVEDILGDRADSVGCLELPIFVGREMETVFAVATDFRAVEKIFDLHLLEIAEIKASDLGDSALVSAEFANSRSLSLGDSFSATVFGTEKTYVVCGIAESDFMAAYDVMVDTSGIVKIMAEDSLLVSAMIDSFEAATVIYISIAEDIDVEECMTLLKADERFADKSINAVYEIVKIEKNVETMSLIVDVVILISALLCAAVVFSCFFVLSSERAEENNSFILSGATRRFIALFEYLEVVVYWAVGSVFGILLSVPLVRFFVGAAGFKYATDKLRVDCVLLSVFFILGILLLTVGAFIFAERFRGRRPLGIKVERRAAAASVAVFLSLLLLLLILPAASRFIVFVICLAALMAALFFCVPVVIRCVAGAIGDALDRRAVSRGGGAPLKYAMKNLSSVRLLQNVSRLVALLLCILASAGMIVASSFGAMSNMEKLFDADYVVLNATDSCTKKLSECENSERNTRVYVGYSYKTCIISVEDLDVLDDGLEITARPEGCAAVVSAGDAAIRNLRVGDSFTLECEGEEIPLTVIEIIDSGYNFVLFDSQSFGVAYNAVMVKGADGVSDGELLSEISDKTADELVAVSSADSFFSEKVETIRVYCVAGAILSLVMLAFAIIGTADSLYDGYRSRRDEFRLYAVSGMTRREVRRMKAYEISLTFAFGILMGLVGFMLSAVVIENGLVSQAYKTFINLKEFFKSYI